MVSYNCFFNINHNCSNFSTQWIAFSSEIDPSDISFDLKEKLFSDKGDKLYSGIFYNKDSTIFYPTFISTKKRAKDLEFFSVVGEKIARARLIINMLAQDLD